MVHDSYAVSWSLEARSDLADIHVFIALGAADRFIEDLTAAVNSLETFPNRGRPAADGSRELVFGAYLVLYLVEDRTVSILRIRHGARRPL